MARVKIQRKSDYTLIETNEPDREKIKIFYRQSTWRNKDVETLYKWKFEENPFGKTLMEVSFDSIKALEVNPRFWATTFQSLCDGVNFIDVAIKSTLDKNYTKIPQCSNRIWGTPYKIPVLILKYRKMVFAKYIFKHTWVQIKYMLFNFFFYLVMGLRKHILRREIERG